MITLTENWKKEFQKSRIKPIVVVKIARQNQVFFKVVDYSSVSSGVDTYKLVNNAISDEVTLGTDHAIGANNSELATNMVNYINTTYTWARARKEDGTSESTVIVTYRDRYYPTTSGTVYAISDGTDITSGFVTSSNESAVEIRQTNPGDEISYCSGDEPYLDTTTAAPTLYSNSVSEISTVSAELDALSREKSTGELEVIFHDDGEIRRLVKNHALRGNRLDAYIGTQDLVFSDFTKLPTVIIREILPDAANKTLTIRCMDTLGLFEHMTWAGEMVNLHPFEAIKKVLNGSGARDGVHYVSSSFDPFDTQFSDRTHFNVSRHHHAIDIRYGYSQNAEISDPVPTLRSIRDIGLLMGGSFNPRNSDGAFEFKKYDSSDSAVRELSAGAESGYDVVDFEVIDSGNESIVNVAEFTFVKFPNEVTRWLEPRTFRQSSVQAVSEFGQEYKSSFDSEWVNTMGLLREAWTSDDFAPASRLSRLTTAAKWITLGQYDCLQGFSGCGGFFLSDASTVALTSALKINGSDGRYGYLEVVGAIQGDVFRSHEPEFIAFSDIIVSNAAPAVGHEVLTQNNIPVAVALRIATSLTNDFFTAGRAGFGTTQKDFEFRNVLYQDTSSNETYPIAFDVTMAVENVQERLKRYQYGCPRAKISTPLLHYDLEVGDFITLDSEDTYLVFGTNGLDNNTVWEITSKETLIFEDQPRVQFELARVRDDFAPVTFFSATPDGGVYIPPPIILPTTGLVVTSDQVAVAIDGGDTVVDGLVSI